MNTPEPDSTETTASKMTPAHLGSEATEADLHEFQEWVSELMRRTGMDEQLATDTIWNNGDYVRGAQKALGI